jgi:3-hydroxyisobutyrate dehydrogenase-like beta-hydroxyacid dehydrogenase
MADIGLIGLGLVGKALVQRLYAAGHVVHGYDIDSACRRDAEALGAHVVPDTAAVAARAQIVLLSLTDADAVEAVLWGSGGLVSVCGEGHTILDTTTTTAESTAAHHARLAEQGIEFVDITLVGSSQLIANHDAVALIGATEDVFQHRALVDTFARAAYYFGEAGAANTAKLVVNLVFGLNRLVLAEGLALAERAGLDARQVLEVLKNSDAYSSVMDHKGEKMLTENFEPVARLAQHAKDVGLILELAQRAGARTPVSQLHAQLLQEAIDLGAAAQDNSAIIRPFREGSREG